MADGKIRLLLLTAEPTNLEPLDLDRERHEIAANIGEGEYRDQFEIVAQTALKRSKFIDLLLEHRPHVVHFGGHGSEAGQIFVLSDDDKDAPISAQALKAVFAEFRDTVRLVFLNACYTKPEAEAIAEVIDCAVGMQTGISDSAALVLAPTFYRAIAYGRTIGDAFNLGKAQLLTQELDGEADVKLLYRMGVDPYLVRMVEVQSAASSEAVMGTPAMETDPTGRVYLSHAESRMPEARLIASAMRDRGIPLCEEALSEDRHEMEGSITEVLRSPGTSGGLISLTSDAVRLESFKRIELPEMLARTEGRGGFFIVAGAFSGFDLGESGVSLRERKVRIHQIDRKTAGPNEASQMARWVLEQRVAAIKKGLHPGDPLRLELYTRVRPPFEQGTALLMDWTERFKQRYATPQDWDQYLLPALHDVVQAIETKAPGCAVRADGRLSLPAAIALGCAFIQPKDIKVEWAQHTAGRPDQLWSISGAREECGLNVTTNAHQPDGSNLAVLVSVTGNVEPEFEASPDLPPFRAMIRAWASPPGTEVLAGAGQAADAAFKIRDTIRAAVTSYPGLSRIHLFMAVPAGLAMMIGQLLNALAPIQTYDLETGDSGRFYRPAALVKPND